jgi:hypothetical protein
MAYINPAELFRNLLFEPVNKPGIDLIPNFMADQRAKDQIAQSQKQFDSLLPGHIATQKSIELENAKKKAQQDLYQQVFDNLVHFKASEPPKMELSQNQDFGNRRASMQAEAQQPDPMPQADPYNNPVVREYLGLKPLMEPKQSPKQTYSRKSIVNGQEVEQRYSYDPNTGAEEPIGKPLIVGKTKGPLVEKKPKVKDPYDKAIMKELEKIAINKEGAIDRAKYFKLQNDYLKYVKQGMTPTDALTKISNNEYGIVDTTHEDWRAKQIEQGIGINQPMQSPFITSTQPQALSQGLPEGLTEDLIKIYTDQGLTRDQVIAAYKQKLGLK